MQFWRKKQPVGCLLTMSYVTIMSVDNILNTIKNVQMAMFLFSSILVT